MGAALAILTSRYTYYALAAGVFAFVLWREHHTVQQRNLLARDNARLLGDLVTERANRATEQADRRKADDAAKSLEAELDRIRSAPQPVSVFCRPARVPGTASQGGAAASAPGAAAGSGAEEPLRDVGAALADVWREHQSNAARQRALIEWERARTH